MMEVYLDKYCFHSSGSKLNEARLNSEQTVRHNPIGKVLQHQTTCELAYFLMSADSSFEVGNGEILFEGLYNVYEIFEN